MIEHTKVSDTEHKFMKKVVFRVMMTVPEQVAANVTELQWHALLAERILSSQHISHLLFTMHNVLRTQQNLLINKHHNYTRNGTLKSWALTKMKTMSRLNNCTKLLQRDCTMHCQLNLVNCFTTLQRITFGKACSIYIILYVYMMEWSIILNTLLQLYLSP